MTVDETGKISGNYRWRRSIQYPDMGYLHYRWLWIFWSPIACCALEDVPKHIALHKEAQTRAAELEYFD